MGFMWISLGVFGFFFKKNPWFIALWLPMNLVAYGAFYCCCLNVNLNSLFYGYIPDKRTQTAVIFM